MRISASSLLTVLGLMFTAACAPSRVPLSVEVDASLATTQWLDDKFGLVNDHELSSFLKQFTIRLGPAAYTAALNAGMDEAEIEQYKNFPWQIFVINSPEPSALSAGAGVTFISKGLFKRLGSEDELAAVIAHEMAHQLLGHVNRVIASQGLSSSSPRFVFTLEHEIAADALGVSILQIARYNPNAALNAITDTFRAREAQGREAHAEWVEPRLTSLHRAIQDLEPAMPAPEDSREFHKVQQRLN